MNIDVHEKDEVRDLGCISCMECVQEKLCPKKSTISLWGKGRQSTDVDTASGETYSSVGIINAVNKVLETAKV